MVLYVIELDKNDSNNYALLVSDEKLYARHIIIVCRV